MSKLSLVLSNSFRNDYEKATKRRFPLNELWMVVDMLLERKKLPAKYKDHTLSGKFHRQRECHIRPDWLLIYAVDENKLILTLTRTGTHSDLF